MNARIPKNRTDKKENKEIVKYREVFPFGQGVCRDPAHVASTNANARN